MREAFPSLQWLGLCTPDAGNVASTLGQGVLRSYIHMTKKKKNKQKYVGGLIMKSYTLLSHNVRLIYIIMSYI